jgi:hypothetical protein
MLDDMDIESPVSIMQPTGKLALPPVIREVLVQIGNDADPLGVNEALYVAELPESLVMDNVTVVLVEEAPVATQKLVAEAVNTG